MNSKHDDKLLEYLLSQAQALSFFHDVRAMMFAIVIVNILLSDHSASIISSKTFDANSFVHRSRYFIFTFNVFDTSNHLHIDLRARVNSSRFINSYFARLIERSIIRSNVIIKILKD